MHEDPSAIAPRKDEASGIPPRMVWADIFTFSWLGFCALGVLTASLGDSLVLAIWLFMLPSLIGLRRKMRRYFLPESHRPVLDEYATLEELAEAHHRWAAFKKAHPDPAERWTTECRMQAARDRARSESRVLEASHASPSLMWPVVLGILVCSAGFLIHFVAEMEGWSTMPAGIAMLIGGGIVFFGPRLNLPGKLRWQALTADEPTLALIHRTRDRVAAIEESGPGGAQLSLVEDGSGGQLSESIEAPEIGP